MEGPLLKVTCKRCGHEWIPRVPKPRRCPKCLAYDWEKEVGKTSRKVGECS